MNDKIIIGSDVTTPLFSFEDKEIRSLGWSTAVDVVGTNLTIDQLIPTVEYPGDGYLNIVIAPSDKSMIVSSDGYIICAKHVERDLRLVSYGTLIQYFRDGVLKHKMYVDTVERIAQNTFKVQAVSAIGILERQKQYGNIYRGALFSAVLTEIIGDAIPYTVEDNVKNITVYGWIPYGSKRLALHQLLFATGVTLSKDENGDIYFHFLNTDNQISVPNERVYINGEVNYPAFASAVDVTEHSFFALEVDERVVVYDNTDGSETANNTLVVFRDGPMHNLQVTGNLVIHSSGVNYAVISGTGALSGQKYTHSTHVLHLDAEKVNDQRENVATVSENYLVSAVNSTNVAKRVLSFYSSRKTISSGIVLENERAGDLVSMMDPYKESITGFIASMDAVVSNIVKANCKIVSGYVPTGQGNNYNHYMMLSGNGNIDLSTLIAGKEDDLVQAVLIGGGNGGQKGNPGEAGGRGSTSDYGTAGEGGKAGQPGNGGKVFTITIHVNDLTNKILSYNCGAGGESGEIGGTTTFGLYTSDDGYISAHGVANIFTGEVYGKIGAPGIDGARGSGTVLEGDGPDLTYNGVTYHAGADGKDVDGYVSGFATGGRGGGASAGSNGGDGEDGSTEYNQGNGFNEGGRGGIGATPVAREKTDIFGQGGDAGHGGGGGGGGGAATGPSGYYWTGTGGAGGAGGLGGQGGPGAIIIYY